MNNQIQTPDPLESVLDATSEAAPVESGAQEAPATPEPSRVDDALYSNAINQLRRIKAPKDMLESMDPETAIQWSEALSPYLAEQSRAHGRLAELEKELESRKAQATPDGTETQELSGVDPDIARVVEQILQRQLEPLTAQLNQAQAQSAQQVLKSRLDSMQEKFPSLSDPRIRFQATEKAEQLYKAYGDAEAALLDAVKLVAGEGRGSVSDTSKQAGQPSAVTRTGGAPEDPQAALMEEARRAIAQSMGQL